MEEPNNSNTVDLTTIDSDDDIVNVTNSVSKYHVIIIGDPTPKPSPRIHAVISDKTKNKPPFLKRWMYNPASNKMKAFRLGAKQQLLSQSPSAPVMATEKVGIKMWFCKRAPPMLFINRDRNRPREELTSNSLSAVMKPDTDNCVKFVLDSLKGVAWKDDNQVCKITAYKCYDGCYPYEGRTVVEFQELNGSSWMEPIPLWGLSPHEPK